MRSASIYRSYSLILGITALIVSSCYLLIPNTGKKINGVSFVAPPQAITEEVFDPIIEMNANWVAITPYAFSRGNTPKVSYNHTAQWWGESRIGTVKQIEYAKAKGLNVMLKPHVWVMGQGWAGDYQLANAGQWKQWASYYSTYILDFAAIADSMQVEMLCIGTEYRKSVTEHPELWIELIKEVRKVYSGKLTYAANWDNYENVTFWDELDYIGIDAYFPLSESKTPNLDQLMSEWTPIKTSIQEFAIKKNKHILFTEYGYESVDFTTAGHWKYDRDTLSVNLEGQSIAYRAMFDSFWQEEWFGGGFLWKWHSDHNSVGGKNHKRYTPQNKPVINLIKQQYASTRQ